MTFDEICKWREKNKERFEYETYRYTVAEVKRYQPEPDQSCIDYFNGDVKKARAYVAAVALHLSGKDKPWYAFEFEYKE